jgi:nucleotide-binding universal stress UspA family protein
MTALANESVRITATCVLVDVRDSGAKGVRWAAACAEALGVGLVVHAGPKNDPAHAAVAALLAEHPELTVHVEHSECTPGRWEGALVVISRARAFAAPPLAGLDLRDVVVVGGSAAAVACRFGVVTAVLDAVGREGVLQRATAFCRARGATRLRVLTRPYLDAADSLDAAADLVHAACPDVIVELVREVRSVQEETRLFPSDLLVVSGRERGPAEGLQPAARAALHHAPCPVLFSCS